MSQTCQIVHFQTFIRHFTHEATGVQIRHKLARIKILETETFCIQFNDTRN